jgi:hypothetical protein
METINNISVTKKELPSGNCQVKFFIEDERRPQYGYLLVSEPKPVGEIIAEIQERLEKRRMAFSGLNPFSLKNNVRDDHDFLLFSA